MHKRFLFGCSIFVLGLFVLTGEPPAPPAVFTAAQAEAGRVAFEKTCGQCHTFALTGRQGAASELPPFESLSPAYQQFATKFGPVPPLAGKAFLARWGSKTVAELVARFQEAVTAFPPDGINNETTVEITAYALQVSGAKAGERPMTRTTALIVGSTIP